MRKLFAKKDRIDEILKRTEATQKEVKEVSKKMDYVLAQVLAAKSLARENGVDV